MHVMSTGSQSYTKHLTWFLFPLPDVSSCTILGEEGGAGCLRRREGQPRDIHVVVVRVIDIKPACMELEFRSENNILNYD